MQKMSEKEAIVFLGNAVIESEIIIEELKKVKNQTERAGRVGEYYSHLENCEKEIESCRVAIQALEEIQQYRAIENELKENYKANVDIKMLMQYFIETIFKDEKHEGFKILTNEDAKMWDAYKAIGTVDEVQADKFKMVLKRHGSLSNMVDALEEYHTIGSEEQCREAVERMKPIYIFGSDYNWTCSACGTFHSTKGKFCSECGHKIELY